MCLLSTKVPIRKKSANLFNDPCIYILVEEKTEFQIWEILFERICMTVEQDSFVISSSKSFYFFKQIYSFKSFVNTYNFK